LYNNFESKEVLVAKYLERLRLKFEENLQQAVSKQGRSLTIPFDLLETTVVQGEFFGCPFTNALTELPESTLVQEEVRKYRGVVLNYFSEFATKEIVQQLMLVYDGAFTSCKLDPNRKGVRVARQFKSFFCPLFCPFFLAKLISVLSEMIPKEIIRRGGILSRLVLFKEESPYKPDKGCKLGLF